MNNQIHYNSGLYKSENGYVSIELCYIYFLVPIQYVLHIYVENEYCTTTIESLG